MAAVSESSWRWSTRRLEHNLSVFILSSGRKRYSHRLQTNVA
jgi:hypothetical protein